MREKRPVAAIFNILVFAFVVVMNTLAVTLPLNNKTTGELSDQYPNYFTPAGFTFSIWGIIYLFLLGFTIYQAVVLFSGKSGAAKVSRITPLFILNGLLNGAWIFAWHYEQVTLSLVIMGGASHHAHCHSQSFETVATLEAFIRKNLSRYSIQPLPGLD